MNRQEYLEKLRRALAQMPPGELEKQIAYYDELISDMCEDGMSETEAVAKLGDPAAVAAELLTALPLGTLVKSRVKSASGLSGLTIALLVLGFPLWFPLVCAAGAVVSRPSITSSGSGASLRSGAKSSTQETARMAASAAANMRDILAIG